MDEKSLDKLLVRIEKFSSVTQKETVLTEKNMFDLVRIREVWKKSCT